MEYALYKVESGKTPDGEPTRRLVDTYSTPGELEVINRPYSAKGGRFKSTLIQDASKPSLDWGIFPEDSAIGEAIKNNDLFIWTEKVVFRGEYVNAAFPVLQPILRYVLVVGENPGELVGQEV